VKFSKHTLGLHEKQTNKTPNKQNQQYHHHQHTRCLAMRVSGSQTGKGTEKAQPLAQPATVPPHRPRRHGIPLPQTTCWPGMAAQPLEEPILFLFFMGFPCHHSTHLPAQLRHAGGGHQLLGPRAAGPVASPFLWSVPHLPQVINAGLQGTPLKRFAAAAFGKFCNKTLAHPHLNPQKVILKIERDRFSHFQ